MATYSTCQPFPSFAHTPGGLTHKPNWASFLSLYPIITRPATWPHEYLGKDCGHYCTGCLGYLLFQPFLGPNPDVAFPSCEHLPLGLSDVLTPLTQHNPAHDGQFKRQSTLVPHYQGFSLYQRPETHQELFLKWHSSLLRLPQPCFKFRGPALWFCYWSLP